MDAISSAVSSAADFTNSKFDDRNEQLNRVAFILKLLLAKNYLQLKFVNQASYLKTQMKDLRDEIQMKSEILFQGEISMKIQNLSFKNLNDK